MKLITCHLMAAFTRTAKHIHECILYIFSTGPPSANWTPNLGNVRMVLCSIIWAKRWDFNFAFQSLYLSISKRFRCVLIFVHKTHLWKEMSKRCGRRGISNAVRPTGTSVEAVFRQTLALCEKKAAPAFILKRPPWWVQQGFSSKRTKTCKAIQQKCGIWLDLCLNTMLTATAKKICGSQQPGRLLCNIKKVILLFTLRLWRQTGRMSLWMFSRDGSSCQYFKPQCRILLSDK